MSEQIPVKNVTPPNESGALYAKRTKIFTKAFTGIFRNIRIAFGAVLFVLFLGTAWINWGDRQAVWWNLPERKFYIFGATFWPQDFMLLSWLLIICAFGLFFITVFAGRVWCGYACPQTTWTWIFMWVEKITEGDRNKRMRLDKAPMSMEKFLRRAAKHSLWLLIGFVTAFTFMGYFSPVRELFPSLISGEASGPVYFWLAFFTVMTYLAAGFMREQVCIYMCPYSRFQSVMFDKDTLIVSYDVERGEKRGARKKGSDYKAEGLGDCIDCNLCVHVCPTGIDIRDGLQIACISCAACVDVCDDVMTRMGYDKGLISYTTEHNLTGTKTKLLRPRLIGYATALLFMIGLFSYNITARTLVELNVIKDRIPYRENLDGRIENVYLLRVINKDQLSHTFTIEATGIEGLRLEGKKTVEVGAGEIYSTPVSLSADFDNLAAGPNKVQFNIKSTDDESIHRVSKTTFIGPQAR